MKAEIHGKFDPRSTLPGDRIEDTLTDAVFSTLSYLPPRILTAVLATAVPLLPLTPDEVGDALIEFWPSFPSGTEPDVVLTVGGWMIVIEAKYTSPFSTGEADIDHQLVGEWRDGLTDAKAKRLQGPVVIAVTDDPAQPADIEIARRAVADLPEFPERDPDHTETIEWISWQNLAKTIEEHVPGLSRQEHRMVEDLFDLMERRGVRRMFEPFNPEDYWMLTSANRVAAKRVFPAIATFNQELLEHLDGRMAWGGSQESIWSYRNYGLTSPTSWPMSYIMLPFWPITWPEREGTQACLYTLFNLNAPRLEVGWFQATRQHGDAKRNWVPFAANLALAINSFGEQHLAVLSTGDNYAMREEARNATDVDADWLAGNFARFSKIRVVRDIPIEDVVSTKVVADMLLEDMATIDSQPAIFESLTAAELLKPGG